MLNLDTHILLHAMAGTVTAAEEKRLRAEEWGISAIVLWEIAKLAQLGRVAIDLGDPEIERFLNQVHIWPISVAIVRTISQLDFRADPADELIAATSVVHRVPLLTRDRKLRRSKVVPLAR